MWMNGQHKYLGLYHSEEEAFMSYTNAIEKENPQFGENFRIFDEDGIDSLRFVEVA